VHTGESWAGEEVHIYIEQNETYFVILLKIQEMRA